MDNTHPVPHLPPLARKDRTFWQAQFEQWQISSLSKVQPNKPPIEYHRCRQYTDAKLIPAGRIGLIHQADADMFYSLSNCKPGTSGIHKHDHAIGSIDRHHGHLDIAA